MRIKTNIVKLLAVLAILGSLVAIAAIPASAATAPISPTSGVVGTSVTVTATGFGASTILTAKFDGVAMTTAPSTVTADTTGAATFAVLVPTAAAGAHALQVTDGVNTITSYFTVQPKLAISSPVSQKGAVGSSITVVGTGFSGAGVTADVKIGGKSLKSGVAVDATGSFTATGTVPALTSGAANVTATDGAGNTNASPAVFTVIPTLAMTPASGLPGATVTMTGTGWLVSDIVSINFGGSAAGNVTTTSTGAINATFTIPIAASAGVKTITAASIATPSITATTTFTVVTRLLTITPQTGPAGTTVIITGSNMTPNGTIAVGALTIGGVAWNTAAIAIDSTGSISPTTLRVPAMSGTLVLGSNTVIAMDSGYLIAANAFVETASTLTVNPTSAPKGTALTFQGTGWVAGSTGTVTINFAGTMVTTVPDGSGNIAAGMTVPTAAVVGANTVTASDGYANSATTTFTVPGAALSVVPAMGAAGSTVTITGTGFAPYTAVTIKIGTYQYLQQPLTDVQGAFTGSITIPGLAPGAQSVSAADGVNNVIAFFTISSAAASTSSQLSAISVQLVRVWGYSNGTWSMYDPADAAGSNLASLTSGAGYWVNVNQACTLIYSGYSYALSTGWNLIGWR